MKPLILIGGGGHCKSVIEASESVGRNIKGILDLPEYFGTDCLGYKVIGNDNNIPDYANECEFIVTLGFIRNPVPRIRLHELVVESGGKFATIIASTAHVSEYADINEGTVILHNASVNACAKIGKGCIINTSANIEHDCVIGDYTHISTGVMVNGGCKIGRNCFIGSGAVIANGVEITEGCIVGAAGFVNGNVTTSGTYVGVPVRKIS